MWATISTVATLSQTGNSASPFAWMNTQQHNILHTYNLTINVGVELLMLGEALRLVWFQARWPAQDKVKLRIQRIQSNQFEIKGCLFKLSKKKQVWFSTLCSVSVGSLISVSNYKLWITSFLPSLYNQTPQTMTMLLPQSMLTLLRLQTWNVWLNMRHVIA